MDDRIRMNLCLDFYEELLTDKQQRICDYYFRNDLSLQEIAEMENVSRAAVHDMIKRCRDELLHYENTLHMAAAYEKRMQLYREIKKTADAGINRLVDQCIDTEIGGGKNE